MFGVVVDGVGEVLFGWSSVRKTRCGFAALTDKNVGATFPDRNVGATGFAASIFHFGDYTVGDVKQYLAKQGIPVRITEPTEA